ncbi:MAG: hypothetical protein AB1758_09940 [Candidatus Eremiobacterota bacterium]
MKEELIRRLTSCLPAATYEMEVLCRLAGVTVSREVSSAAVECCHRPRLTLNPDFVETYCQTDEHLFLLVMHELWHVLLAHTRLFPRMSEVDNIVFDAVINASLCREFPQPEYLGFFEAINPFDSVPGLLLRPPVGWPEAPRYLALGKHLVKRLYPRPGENPELPSYAELREFLEPLALTKYLLLGDHDWTEGELRALDDPLFGETIRRIVASWPTPPVPRGGRSAGGALDKWLQERSPASAELRRAFARVLRRALLRPTVPRRHPVEVREPAGLGVIPTGFDRLAFARQLLGYPATLWVQRPPRMARRLELHPPAFVYLDVSGSMQLLLPTLLGLLVPLAEQGRLRVFQFSTMVRRLPLDSLRRGELTSTMGTEIACVVRHLEEHPRIRKAVILTDGLTGRPAAELPGREIHVCLSPGGSPADLKGWASSLTELPPC